MPDFTALDAFVTETQTKVRDCFVRILGSGLRPQKGRSLG